LHGTRSDSTSSLARHEVHITSNIELLDLLALTCDVAAGEDAHFRSQVVARSQLALRSLAADVGLGLREYGNEMQTAIARVRIASDAILAFPRSEAAVQVDIEPHADAETQTTGDGNQKVAAPSKSSKTAAPRKKSR
jgi:hypothetical protein